MWAGQYMIHFVTHMICELTTLGDRGTIRSVLSTCKTQLFCAMNDPEHKPSKPSTFLENWNTGSLAVAQAAYIAPLPGVIPFEDCIGQFILSLEASKTHNGAQHVSQPLNSMGKTEAGKETNRKSPGRVGPLQV
jgi:hypothetical protein